MACLQSRNGRIEALQMAHLQDLPVFFGQVSQALACLGGSGDRFFHEHIHAGAEQFCGQALVSHGRRGHGRGFDAARQLIESHDRLDAVFAGQRAGSIEVGIDNGDKIHARPSGSARVRDGGQKRRLRRRPSEGHRSFLLLRFVSHNGQAAGIRPLDHGIPIQQQSASGVHRQSCSSRLQHRFDGG